MMRCWTMKRWRRKRGIRWTGPAGVSERGGDGSSLTLTHGEALDGGSRPGTGDFTVEVGGTGRSVSAVSVSGKRGDPDARSCGGARRYGNSGELQSGTQPIQDAVGNNALGLSSQSVTKHHGSAQHGSGDHESEFVRCSENQALVRRLAARDDDPGDEVTGWEIVGGADRLAVLCCPRHWRVSFGQRRTSRPRRQRV